MDLVQTQAVGVGMRPRSSRAGAPKHFRLEPETSKGLLADHLISENIKRTYITQQFKKRFTIVKRINEHAKVASSSHDNSVCPRCR